jgi:hypothetical protein
MARDPIPPREARSTDGDTRTEDAKRVIDDCASALRAILEKLRRLFKLRPPQLAASFGSGLVCISDVQADRH